MAPVDPDVVAQLIEDLADAGDDELEDAVGDVPLPVLRRVAERLAGVAGTPAATEPTQKEPFDDLVDRYLAMDDQEYVQVVIDVTFGEPNLPAGARQAVQSRRLAERSLAVMRSQQKQAKSAQAFQEKQYVDIRSKLPHPDAALPQAGVELLDVIQRRNAFLRRVDPAIDNLTRVVNGLLAERGESPLSHPNPRRRGLVVLRERHYDEYRDIVRELDAEDRAKAKAARKANRGRTRP